MDWPDASHRRARARNHRPSETAAEADRTWSRKATGFFDESCDRV